MQVKTDTLELDTGEDGFFKIKILPQEMEAEETV